MFDGLPESTSDIALDVFNKTVDAERAAAWAQDLLVIGIDSEKVVQLAILGPLDWPSARELVPEVAAAIGLRLDEPDTVYRWVERGMLRAFLGGALSDDDFTTRGYRLWMRLLKEGVLPNPFKLYGDLDYEVMVESGGKGLDKISGGDTRKWLIDKLAADGAFDRTGLSRP